MHSTFFAGTVDTRARVSPRGFYRISQNFYMKMDSGEQLFSRENLDIMSACPWHSLLVLFDSPRRQLEEFQHFCEKVNSDSEARVGVRIRRCGHGGWFSSSSCRARAEGVFWGPAHRCRSGGHVHRDMAPIIKGMRAAHVGTATTTTTASSAQADPRPSVSLVSCLHCRLTPCVMLEAAPPSGAGNASSGRGTVMSA